MYKIGFPHVGNYSIPARFLFSNILDCDIIEAPSITNKTIEIGVKYSPEFVCTPFKYTLGTMLEVIESGADVVIQLGGGCRYGYYHELQRQIISDLGYDVRVVNLVSAGRADVFKICRELRSIDPKFSCVKALYYLVIVKRMIKYMDIVDDYIRCNVGFEVEKGLMEKYNMEMLNEFLSVRNIFQLKRIFNKYFGLIKGLKLDIPRDVVRIGVIGELYTVMEPFSFWRSLWLVLVCLLRGLLMLLICYLLRVSMLNVIFVSILSMLSIRWVRMRVIML